MVSNRGGPPARWLAQPFDQLAEIVDAVGDKIDVICDGGITRGTCAEGSLVGAKACSGGRFYPLRPSPLAAKPASSAR